jgi:carbonic anhydrase
MESCNPPLLCAPPCQDEYTPNKFDLDSRLGPLLANNRKWSKARVKEEPEFFNSLRDQQNPEYLW